MLWEIFLKQLCGFLICRVRRLFWSAPSFLRWRDQNFTPSAQAGSPPSPEVSWQHTYYTRYMYNNKHIRCINLANHVFKRPTLINATYFFGNHYFILDFFGIHLDNLLIIIPQISMAAYIQYMHFNFFFTFLRWFSNFFYVGVIF